ncbi:LysR family transcriptional regulator [Sphingobium sp. HBC34]|uniref:LysR family transcriptional regulator n=1 Tax=Sphingobium cyanobacteriorum TaxID=3063954 RepID=A0ABT8ZIY9_9SPHN|nr:LysR family transcriptional regulator [Sphingobium sp. HBC34]MDO7833994.1 LysR family transcriptional regulator [Sphingobium sp. HBC34]
MKRIALYHLETLTWIARLGTFQAAAERLHTTQPAISARVREVEDQLGIALFRREGRRMVLTARGRLLIDSCEPLWTGLEQALLDISDFAGASGMIRIGSGEIAAASCLPAFIQAVERDMPGVSMEVELDLTARMLQLLLTGARDLVFLAGPVASPNIRTQPIGALHLAWVAGRAVAQAGGFARPLPVWSLPDPSPIHGAMRDALAQQGVAARSINSCNNVRTLVEIVANGGGAAVLPETMVRGEIASGRLVEILPRPDRMLHFEAAIRAREQEPLVLELFRRTAGLQIDPG